MGAEVVDVHRGAKFVCLRVQYEGSGERAAVCVCVFVCAIQLSVAVLVG